MGRFSSYLRVGFMLLILNSGYLLSSNAPSIFYAANVLFHVALSLGLTGLAIYGYRRLPKHTLINIVLGASALTGLALVVLGAGTATRPILLAHIAVASLAAAAVVVALSSKLALVALGLAALLPLATTVRNGLAPPPAINAELAPISMESEAMGGASGPFFPSSAETLDGATIPSKFFMGSEECGRCHTDIYDHWESSAHRKASFNNQWYRKSIEYMQKAVGTEPSKWCGGCHDHALLFSGMMDTPIEEIIDRPEAHAGLSCTSCHSIVRVKNTMGNAGFVIEYPALHDLATSENRVVRALHDLLLHLDPEPHRETFLKPLHTGDSSAFCSTCHKVHLDAPVNHYRWLRGFNSYDNWQASGVSGEGARSFYYPDTPKTCTDCHMPFVPGYDPAAPAGLLRSHRFAAANTAIPTAYGDDTQLQAVRDFLRAGQVTVDLFALVRSEEPPEAEQELGSRGQPRQLASTFAVGEEAAMAIPGRMVPLGVVEEVIAPLDRTQPSVMPGESVRIDAVVRTRHVGHFFPGGTVDAFDVWVELKAVDDEGRTIFWSGYTDDDGKGPVEPGAHFYRSLLLDAKGQPINKRNAWAARSVLYVQLIAPGSANTVRFRLHVPEEVGSEIRLEAKLNYRKFAWWNTQWAYAGVREAGVTLAPDYDTAKWSFTGPLDDVSGTLKAIPDVPIVTMASAMVTLPVSTSRASVPVPSDPVRDDSLRFNDYGIGLLLQGDLKAAEKAFITVTELDPDYADGWVNVARVRVQEGDPEGAQAMLDEALARAPDLAKAHYFYGLTLKTQGLYDEALTHFRRAAQSYPRDRVVRNQIGRLHFLKREFETAVEELQQTLRVDPENLEAHYNLMLSYQGIGNTEKAALHRELYLRFKADEAAQFITGDYRRDHPEDNNERLPIHEHRSSWP